ncbi:MAG: cellulase family glycosylhydrolase [Candidatus Bathyarchaeia archaeon]
MDCLKPYSHIRGANYLPPSFVHFELNDQATLDREMSYAERLGLNSVRVYLHYEGWKNNPTAYLKKVKEFMHLANNHGITVMFVVWDSSRFFKWTYSESEKKWIYTPDTLYSLESSFWPEGEEYVQSIVENLSCEPNLLMWDMMNEPLCPILLHMDPDSQECKDMIQKMWGFVRHFCKLMKELDKKHPVTVGATKSRIWNLSEVREIGADIDVISIHDYSPDRATLRENINEGINLAQEFQKPLLISEIGCLCRANPYDMALEICQEYGIGWYLWELIIRGYWADVHGIVYPDGTVRDPSIVAAIRGFFRKRTGDIVKPKVDREYHASLDILAGKKWLSNTNADYKEGLRILERIANHLEACELVPMNDPPTRRVILLSEETPENRAELCRLLVIWSEILSQHCQPLPSETPLKNPAYHWLRE